MRKHFPLDALAHLTIPLSEGLSGFPLVLKVPPPPGENIPPPLLMARTYKALKVRSQLLMLEEWNSFHPPPDYYEYPCRRAPHPFMAWTSSSQDTFIRCAPTRATWPLTPPCGPKTLTPPTPAAVRTPKRSNRPSYSAPPRVDRRTGTGNRPCLYLRTAPSRSTMHTSTR